MGKIWRRLTDCLESVPMSCLSLSFNYRKWVVEAEKRLDSIVTSKRMHAGFAVFSTIHSRILLTECASESLYSVQNIAIHRIRLIFDSSNTLVYRLGPSTWHVWQWTQFEIPSVKTVPGGVFLHTPDSLDQGLLDATCDWTLDSLPRNISTWLWEWPSVWCSW